MTQILEHRCGFAPRLRDATPAEDVELAAQWAACEAAKAASRVPSLVERVAALETQQARLETATGAALLEAETPSV